MYEYDTTVVGQMMNNLCYMIDLESSECAVPADKERELTYVKTNISGGVQQVNTLVAGVVVGSAASIQYNIVEVDAAICGEMESLAALDIPSCCSGNQRALAKKILSSAGSGGRVEIVKYLLKKWFPKEEGAEEVQTCSSLLLSAKSTSTSANCASG